ncbi:hypothetical protein BV25DRAFT_1899358 [Artomyces pyxidatus]|uniref:Uncharacterized protein n=1 Tax=Artomyces pyxidatus TaxID=48021 RepID=A0ACB8T4C2_9AGAM|nr:hypothetical protein BV25DRAFT_1899358 [Artomyces pyxidatus]
MPLPVLTKTVEESKAQRLQQHQARFRDRGGIFVPAATNPLIDILLSRAVNGESPSKPRATSARKPVAKSGTQRRKGTAARPAKKARKAKAPAPTDEDEEMINPWPSTKRTAATSKSDVQTAQTIANLIHNIYTDPNLNDIPPRPKSSKFKPAKTTVPVPPPAPKPKPRSRTPVPRELSPIDEGDEDAEHDGIPAQSVGLSDSKGKARAVDQDAGKGSGPKVGKQRGTVPKKQVRRSPAAHLAAWIVDEDLEPTPPPPTKPSSAALEKKKRGRPKANEVKGDEEGGTAPAPAKPRGRPKKKKEVDDENVPTDVPKKKRKAEKEADTDGLSTPPKKRSRTTAKSKEVPDKKCPALPHSEPVNDVANKAPPAEAAPPRKASRAPNSWEDDDDDDEPLAKKMRRVKRADDEGKSGKPPKQPVEKIESQPTRDRPPSESDVRPPSRERRTHDEAPAGNAAPRSAAAEPRKLTAEDAPKKRHVEDLQQDASNGAEVLAKKRVHIENLPMHDIPRDVGELEDAVTPRPNKQPKTKKTKRINAIQCKDNGFVIVAKEASKTPTVRPIPSPVKARDTAKPKPPSKAKVGRQPAKRAKPASKSPPLDVLKRIAATTLVDDDDDDPIDFLS